MQAQYNKIESVILRSFYFTEALIYRKINQMLELVLLPSFPKRFHSLAKRIPILFAVKYFVSVKIENQEQTSKRGRLLLYDKERSQQKFSKDVVLLAQSIAIDLESDLIIRARLISLSNPLEYKQRENMLVWGFFTTSALSLPSAV